MKKNTKRRNTVARRRLKAVLVAVSCLLLVSLISVGGTMAWLVATSTDVKNTFTAGDINIELKETPSTYKMVPGNKIAKDPKVTVTANSEACWLFVEITKGGSYDTFLEEYAVRTKNAQNETEWTELSSAATDKVKVYYREVPASEDDQSFYVLQEGTGDYKNGYVVANTSFTKQDVEKMKDTTNTTVTPPPSLSRRTPFKRTTLLRLEMHGTSPRARLPATDPPAKLAKMFIPRPAG